MPASDPRTAAATQSWLWWLLLLPAAAAATVFTTAVALRIGYPHDLEWMEGALADHAARVAAGLQLYAPPTVEHLPFLYAPLQFWLGALGIAIGLDGVQALRLWSALAAIAAAALAGDWVRREAGRAVPGLVAGGLFLAGYGWLWWWYDLARNDTLFVATMLATGWLLRHGGQRGWLWAGLAATAAFLAKQTALMWLPALAVGALCRDRRRAAGFIVAAGGGIAAATGMLHVTSDGWSTFFLFAMPRGHGFAIEHWLRFWTADLAPMLPLVALGLTGFAAAWRAGARGTALELAAFGAGGLLASWLSRLHTGGFDNVLMYGFAGGCVLGPAAAAGVPRLRWLGPVLLLAQFAWLGDEARRRNPNATLLPSAAHRRAHDELRAFVAAQDGPVWIPARGHIGQRLGKGTGAHGQAIFDLLQLLPRLPDGMLDLAALAAPEQLEHLAERERLALAGFMASARDALRGGRFAAIVVDATGAGMFPLLFADGLAGPDGVPGTSDDPYHRLPGPLLSEPDAIRPLVGYDVRAPYALVRR